MVIRRFTSRVLFTGANGQIGASLIKLNQQKFGSQNILATDLIQNPSVRHGDIAFKRLDVSDPSSVEKIFKDFQPTQVYHLAALLSAASELNPQVSIKVNINGFHNILQNSRQVGAKLFVPSSIASFGELTPKKPSNMVIQRPGTIYGVAKVHIELMGEYYFNKFGLDFRSLRIPQVVSQNQVGPGSASFTTNLFNELISKKETIVPLGLDVKMPLIYITDLLNSVIKFMEADSSKLRHRTYTMGCISCSVEEYIGEVTKYFEGEFKIQPDFRDKIVRSWCDDTDCREAFEDWGHRLEYDLKSMIQDIYVKRTGKKEPCLDYNQSSFYQFKWFESLKRVLCKFRGV